MEPETDTTTTLESPKSMPETDQITQDTPKTAEEAPGEVENTTTASPDLDEAETESSTQPEA